MRWALIDGFDGAYRVSDYGHVQSSFAPGRRGMRGPWRPLAKPLDKAGYELAYLWDSVHQVRVRRLVHRLVAEAFCAGRKPGLFVNHLDGDKLNNFYLNLEWCTNAENTSHAWQTGLCRAPKLTLDKAREILVYPANDTLTGQAYGVSQVMVTRIRAGKAWKAAQAA